MEHPADSAMPPSVERTLVRVGSYSMVGVGAIGTLNNLALGLEPITTSALAVAAMAGALLAWAERRGADTLRIAVGFVLVTSLGIAASWLPSGGVRSSVASVVPILACIGVLMFPSRAAGRFLTAAVLLVLGLSSVEWLAPSWVAPLPPRAVGLVDATTAMVVAIVAIGLATLAMRRAYERDQLTLRDNADSLRQAHVELEAALEAARAANDAKSRFLANMSHELRTPLAGIVGRLELLERQALQGGARAHVDAARRSASHLRSLVDDLLDLGRIERDDFVIASQPLRPATLVADVCDDSTVPGGPTVVGSVDPALPDVLVTDAMRLRQIATNLVANAVRHAQATRIELRIEAAGTDRLRLTVTDDGRGIAQDVVPRLFEPFARGDASGSSGGLGLGLYVVRTLVDAMGGTLDVTSSELGARFSVTLPYESRRLSVAAAAADRPSSVAAAAPTRRATAGLRVLSAEDDATLRVMLAAMFDELGVDAVLVVDGEEAVARAADAPFDAVFLDMNMPRLGGPAAASRIVAMCTERGRPMPRLVALTANAYAADVAACQRAGMTHFLQKPVTLADLERALAGLTPVSA